MKRITYKRLSNTVSAILIIAFIYVLVVTLSGCQSQSGPGHRTEQPLEKVIIIDSYGALDIKTSAQVMYKYKVKRISYGVIDMIYEYNQYETGDTIFHRFAAVNNNIRR